MDVLFDSIDFLPDDFNPMLKIFVYVLIIIHVLAFAFWCVLACPGMFTKKDSFQDQVNRMLEKNKEKNN
jgi:hypothetical protein